MSEQVPASETRPFGLRGLARTTKLAKLERLPSRYRLSVHHAAALVIGRRGLGFAQRVSKPVVSRVAPGWSARCTTRTRSPCGPRRGGDCQACPRPDGSSGAVSGRAAVAPATSDCPYSRLVSNGDDGTPYDYVLRAEERFAQAGVRRVAVLGAGGMSFGRRGGFSPTFVDVDRRVADAARALHPEAPPAGPLVVRDARAWLRTQPPGSLDGVLLDVYRDVYSGCPAVPEHLLTYELFALVHSRLAPDGVLAFTVVRETALDAYAYRLDRTLRTVFADCSFEWIREPPAQTHGSALYWCRPHRLDGDLRVYRDATTLAGIEPAGG